MKPGHYLLIEIKRFQQKAANFLGWRINKYPVGKLKIGLLVGGITIGTFCLMLIIGVVGSESSQRALQVDSISTPRGIHQFSMDSLKTLPAKVIDSLESIIRRYYTDQLR